jgi:hypothetical protein
LTRQRKDPLVEVRRRVDSFLSIDVQLMISRGQLAQPQLNELIGILGLWMLATVGMVEADIARAIAGFLQALTDTYADDPRSLSEKLHIHMESAFRDNPALVKLKELIGDAMATDANDPASQASTRFVACATAPVATPEILSYFDVLTGAG